MPRLNEEEAEDEVRREVKVMKLGAVVPFLPRRCVPGSGRLYFEWSEIKIVRFNFQVHGKDSPSRSH